jgi:hypothetical protein
MGPFIPQAQPLYTIVDRYVCQVIAWAWATGEEGVDSQGFAFMPLVVPLYGPESTATFAPGLRTYFPSAGDAGEELTTW